MNYQELEQCIRFAVFNDYHILRCESDLDFAIIKSKRILLYGKNVQQMFNTTLEKLRKETKRNGKA